MFRHFRVKKKKKAPTEGGQEKGKGMKQESEPKAGSLVLPSRGDLPHELIDRIFSFLTPQELCAGNHSLPCVSLRSLASC